MNKRINNCHIHGDFEQVERPSPFAEITGDINKKIWVGSCKKCDQVKEESEANIAKSNYERTRLNTGISIRNLGKTFDDYICEPMSKQESAKRKFMKLSEGLQVGDGHNIIACGGVGTGKTLLACALIDSICDKRTAKIVTIMDLFRELKDSWKKNAEFSEREIITRYAKLDLLIIDEIGVQFGSDTEKLFIFDIINGRYENVKPTVLLSNLSIDVIKDVIGERVIDRLRDDGGQLVVFDWESMRGAK